MEDNKVVTGGYEVESKGKGVPVTPEAIGEIVDPKINELRKEIENSKKDYITILGIFASFITFVSVEFKLFEGLTDFSNFLSLSILLVSLMMFFVITLIGVIKNDDDKFYKRPLFKLAVCLFIISLAIYSIPKFFQQIENSKKINTGYYLNIIR